MHKTTPPKRTSKVLSIPAPKVPRGLIIYKACRFAAKPRTARVNQRFNHLE